MAKRGVFSLFDLDGFIRSAGAQRVDERASAKLGEVLEDSGMQLLHKARVFARHAGRRDVLAQDVILAAKLLREDTAR